MIFDDSLKSPRSTSIDRSAAIPLSSQLLLFFCSFSRHLKQILKLENVKSELCAILAHRYCFGFYTSALSRNAYHLKNVVQKNVPSISSSSRALTNAAPSSDRSIEVSRSMRILDMIDCQHPASRTQRIEDRSTNSSSSLLVLG